MSESSGKIYESLFVTPEREKSLEFVLKTP